MRTWNSFHSSGKDTSWLAPFAVRASHRRSSYGVAVGARRTCESPSVSTMLHERPNSSQQPTDVPFAGPALRASFGATLRVTPLGTEGTWRLSARTLAGPNFPWTPWGARQNAD